MKILITDIRNISVNGSPVGALVNAFQESKDPVAVQLALESHFDGLTAEHADALSAAEFKYTTDVSRLNDQIDAANARIAAAVVAKEKLLAAAKDPDIDANIVIGGIIAEAEATETEKRRFALAAEIAAKQAELESL